MILQSGDNPPLHSWSSHPISIVPLWEKQREMCCRCKGKAHVTPEAETRLRAGGQHANGIHDLERWEVNSPWLSGGWGLVAATQVPLISPQGVQSQILACWTERGNICDLDTCCVWHCQRSSEAHEGGILPTALADHREERRQRIFTVAAAFCCFLFVLNYIY